MNLTISTRIIIGCGVSTRAEKVKQIITAVDFLTYGVLTELSS
jgi:hypothetical protein